MRDVRRIFISTLAPARLGYPTFRSNSPRGPVAIPQSITTPDLLLHVRYQYFTTLETFRALDDFGQSWRRHALLVEKSLERRADQYADMHVTEVCRKIPKARQLHPASWGAHADPLASFPKLLEDSCCSKIHNAGNVTYNDRGKHCKLEGQRR